MSLPAADPEPILGSTMPRIATPPLIGGDPGPCGCGCALDETTSYGFDVVDFARDILGTPLDPWQRWLVIHAGELLQDGRPRFRTVLLLVSRQVGKTFLGVVLTLFWLFVERHQLILGTSTNRDTAKESWRAAVNVAQTCEWLAEDVRPPRYANGEETLETVSDGCRYRIAASNRRGGRGMTINRLILDELREHVTYEAVDAAVPATNAVPDAQIWALTNQGGDDSVVLRAWHAAALAYIDSGEGDHRLGVFEWSAPPGADPTDPHALAQANPAYGRRIDPDALMGQAIRAKNAGGAELASFRTEILCQKVDLLDPAIDPDAWRACGTNQPTDLAPHRRNVALCVDVALDGSHATLAAAASLDGAVHVEIVHHWEGRGCTGALRESLPAIVARVKPGAVGWFPTGPAASVAAELAERKGGTWPPAYVKVEEIRGSLTAVCMGLAELVTTRQLRHPHDDLLNTHIRAAQKAKRGDGWIFARQDSGGPIDATYAVAGAAHLARTMAVKPRPKIVTRRPREANLRPV